MRLKIITGILVLVIASFAVSGSTVAFFTSGSNVSNTFTAGTVQISVSEPTETGWMPGDEPGEECNTIEWSITNDGTKSAFVRVRPIVDIDHTGGGYLGPLDAWLYQIEGYYTTTKNNLPKIVNIVQGDNNNIIGTANIFISGIAPNDPPTGPNQYLNINFSLNDPYRIAALRIFAGLQPPVGDLANYYNYDPIIFSPPYVQSYNFQTDYVLNQAGQSGNRQINSFGGNTNMYIKAYLIVYEICQEEGSVEWSVPTPYSQQWDYDIIEEWWYYPGIVGPGNTVNFGVKVCKTPCFFGDISLHLDAEAVQSTHGAKEYEWGENP